MRGLTKSYGPVEAVRGVSFEVSSAEIFGLLGPNGAGKTTTLECILGLRRPDSGTITIRGIDALSHPEQAKQWVGAQLQSAVLQDKLTPRQALKFFTSFYRRSPRSDDLLEQFVLVEKADAPFDSLSSGQKQRLFLALAFANDPQLVVLDEPTVGLDPPSRRELHRIIADMRTSGRTVLLSTHYLEEAQDLCDRIAILDEGRIIAAAKPEELIARARATPRVTVRTATPLMAVQAASLPGVLDSWREGEGWVLSTREVNRTIVGLVRSLESEKNMLLDLQIHRTSLEDVFMELTGRAWPPPRPENC